MGNCHFFYWFPFNWFPLREGSIKKIVEIDPIKKEVSIQLVSPARGELAKSFPTLIRADLVRFPFNWFPLREGS